MSDGMPDGPPTLSTEGAVARISFNRPDQHNRFQARDIDVLSEMLENIDRDRSIRVLTIGARGPSFSAGSDLSAVGGEDNLDQTLAFHRLCDRVEELSVPTICALGGSVYGGATDFALACDLRIGVEGIKMMMPPARLGIQYSYGGMRRYVERLGLSAAKRLFLTSETIDAQTMLRIGFLDEIVARDVLADHVSGLAASIAERAPDALRGLKRSLNDISNGSADPAEIQSRFKTSLLTRNAQEGVAAWREKRKAAFFSD